LRETERLRKIIIRNGGASYFNADCPTDIGARRQGTPTTTDSTRSKSASRAALRDKSRSRTPTLAEESRSLPPKDVSQSHPPPPPPQPTPSSLNWTAVRQSMQNEEESISISNKEALDKTLFDY